MNLRIAWKPRTLGQTMQDAIDSCSLRMASGESLDDIARSYGLRREPAAQASFEFPLAAGRALSALALSMYGLRRLWYEHAPWLGDRWLRRRMREAWKPVLDTRRAHP